MNTTLWTVIGISELMSAFLLCKLWAKKGRLLVKVLLSIIALIPIVGPILYLFVTDQSEPQGDRNTRPRGDYTHVWISVRPIWRKSSKQDKEQESIDPDRK